MFLSLEMYRVTFVLSNIPESLDDDTISQIIGRIVKCKQNNIACEDFLQSK